jgi:hypothetical protein
MGVFLFLVVVCFFGFAIYGGIAKANAIAKAKADYQASLAELTAEPTSPARRKTTLELGRAYSNLTRDKKGVTLFDEVALMNDINAACGGATTLASSSQQPNASPSLSDRLSRLQQLKDQSLISDAEFQLKRQQLMSEI